MTINILGTSLTIQADENPEYIKRVSSYVNETIEKLQKSTNQNDPMKLLILAGLTITDELFKAQNKENYVYTDQDPEEYQEMKEITERLIRELDHNLE